MQKFIVEECQKNNVEVPDNIEYVDFRELGVHSPQKLKEMQQLAYNRGGWCLSPIFITMRHKLWWQCGEGHVWDSTPGSLKYSDSWCKYCKKGKKGYNVKHTIEEMQEIALDRGGWCLSLEYTNVSNELWWQCHEGHVWSAPPKNVIGRDKTWCPICGRSKRKYKKFPHKHQF